MSDMGKKTATLLLAVPIVAYAGCRVHPMSLAIDVTQELVGCEDVSARAPRLVGRPESAADRMFGRRHDVLESGTAGERWIIYNEAGDQFSDSFYVVTVTREGRITGLFRCRRNSDGLADVYKSQLVRDRVHGKTVTESEASLGLGGLVRVSTSQATGMEARFYDAGDLTHLGGTRYCILCFDHRGLCRDVRMVAVTCQ